MPTKLAVTARIAAVLLTLTAALVACTTSVSGRAVLAPREPAPVSSSGEAGPPKAKPPPIFARDLLLHDGDSTPLGPAAMTELGDSYFTSVRPPECSAALLFKGSPLRPPHSTDYADSAYGFGGTAMYSESVDVYDNALDVHEVVWNGFRAVSRCTAEATGIAPLGEFGGMRLSQYGVSADGVLVWTMTRPDWTCDYGLVAVPRAALLLTLCDHESRLRVADWASTRRAQILGRSA
ncbi:sensor domain-containing protein [Mycobacterium heckeshornense]|uniref:Putative lipoprotein LprH n=1 Tax=Mycobacterium heckeshornense TaxID=110505 RepID=A0A2G8B7A2_9MYCO|nr:sensor domain-containing protein [Mycobacterium heckeshornense]KMV21051.1 lipoprotein LprH [Mycobacterium heckeshornense]MCV7035986.1 sensor domain-containing protein [Mycobacterium heckeshornense]PIJ33602.1 sensor domain-containing protein [Mycobacterium heckeshornense]BCO36695.1 putative lipoprotein LprH [Mycobacterium heckeshornense]